MERFCATTLGVSHAPPNPLPRFEAAHFDALGDEVDAQWRAQNYDERVFPALAQEALARHALHQRFDADAFFRWAIATPRMTPQLDVKGDFGEPPVTMYRGPRFYLEVLPWLDGTTSIHEHAFSGAFQVLSGSSLHSTHQFHVERAVSEQLELGRLELRGTELLSVGAIRPIQTRGLIHALFHLDHPSISLVLRTYRDVRALPQRHFYPPGVAVDTDFVEERLAHRLRLLKSLFKAKQSSYLSALSELLRSADLLSAFKVLKQANELVGHTRAFGFVLEEARGRHGTAVDFFAPVFEQLRRESALTSQRKKVKDADGRFFLALLLNLRSREDILRVLQARWPETDPADLALRLLERVADPQHDPQALAPSAIELGSHGRAFLRERLHGVDARDALQSLEGSPNPPSPEERTRLLAVDASLRTTHAYAALFRER